MRAVLIVSAVSALLLAWVVIVTHATDAVLQWYYGRPR